MEQHKLGHSNFSNKLLKLYANLYNGMLFKFEYEYVQMLLNHYKDMPYGIRLRLKEYLKHDGNPLVPKENIGTALAQSFIEYAKKFLSNENELNEESLAKN